MLRDDPRRSADLARADLPARRDLEADRLARAPVAAGRAGLVRGRRADARRPHYGAVFFEPVPEAALVLGGRRRHALRLRGPRRPGREHPRAAGRHLRRRPTLDSRRRGGVALRGARRRRRASRPPRRGRWSACPASSTRSTGRSRWLRMQPASRDGGIRGRAAGAARSDGAPSRTTSISPRSASGGAA